MSAHCDDIVWQLVQKRNFECICAPGANNGSESCIKILNGERGQRCGLRWRHAERPEICRACVQQPVGFAGSGGTSSYSTAAQGQGYCSRGQYSLLMLLVRRSGQEDVYRNSVILTMWLLCVMHLSQRFCVRFGLGGDRVW